MDNHAVKRKRRRLTSSLAAVGFIIAAVFWAYSELTDSSPPKPVNFPLVTAFMILCPPSLLTIPFIDIEPGSINFAITWFVVGLVNSGLYALIGAILGRLCWKQESQKAGEDLGTV